MIVTNTIEPNIMGCCFMCVFVVSVHLLNLCSNQDASSRPHNSSVSAWTEGFADVIVLQLSNVDTVPLSFNLVTNHWFFCIKFMIFSHAVLQN